MTVKGRQSYYRHKFGASEGDKGRGKFVVEFEQVNTFFLPFVLEQISCLRYYLNINNTAKAANLKGFVMFSYEIDESINDLTSCLLARWAANPTFENIESVKKTYKSDGTAIVSLDARHREELMEFALEDLMITETDIYNMISRDGFSLGIYNLCDEIVAELAFFRLEKEVECILREVDDLKSELSIAGDYSIETDSYYLDNYVPSYMHTKTEMILEKYCFDGVTIFRGIMHTVSGYEFHIVFRDDKQAA